MESAHNTGNKISGFSKGLMIAFGVALLYSIYLLFSLPSDLRFKGNLQYFDLVTPVLIKLYLALGLTALLAIITLYAEMKNTKVAIVYKDKTASEMAEEKTQSEITRSDTLDSKAITAKNDRDLLNDSLSALSKRLDGVAGACYMAGEEQGSQMMELVSGFALPLSESDVVRFNYGEGLVGQVAKSGIPIYLDEIPEGYFHVVSGLGQTSPRFVLILPMKKSGEVKGVLEVATFRAISAPEKQMAEKFASDMGERLS